ncbi:hypothetical protein SLEP1_g38306 [Rubroshorea leprosula]|uniref:Uncharacterized protein n=1 Tax=Rubroshorea leprosula TaxID=152421 RepID=A0AAV5KXS5_9ROSI|nr:hypothetical protein SLEP1_g38306 [Rubroshorea leprosula]
MTRIAVLIEGFLLQKLLRLRSNERSDRLSLQPNFFRRPADYSSNGAGEFVLEKSSLSSPNFCFP